MSAMKRIYEDLIESVQDAILMGYNTPKQAMAYVNKQSPVKTDEEMIEAIFDQMNMIYDQEYYG